MADKPNGHAAEEVKESQTAGDQTAGEETPDLGTVLAETYDAIESRQSGEETGEQAAGDANETEEGQSEEEVETEEEEQPAVEAPDHWSDDDKELLASLPDDQTRQKVLDWRKSIETNASTKTEEAAALKREYGEVDEAIKPLEPELRANGIGKGDAIKRLVGAEQLLRTDPVRGMEYLAQNYGRSGAGTGQAQEIVRRVATALGVDVGGSQQKEAGQADTDPTASRVEALERTVEEQRRAWQAEQQRQQQAAKQQAENTIKQFAEAKDEAGNPIHPHFEAVETEMAALMQAAAASGQEITLDQAYERAVWSRGDLRDGLLKAQRDADAKKRAAEQKAHVEKAKAAKTPKSTGAPPAKTDDSNLPTGDILSQEYDRIFSGASR